LLVQITLPVATVNTSTTNFTEPVQTTVIDPGDMLVGFQADLTFDSTIIDFEDPPVSSGALTSNNWNVSGNVFGSGQIKTLRISAFSEDFTPISGSGILFNLNLIRVSSTPGASTA